MSRGIYQIATGMMLELKRQEHIARNLAGSNLPGYRGEHVIANSFRVNLDSQMGNFRSDNIGYGISGGTELVDFNQGPLQNTGRSLDFAINGEGLFTVVTGDGQTLYTRNGSFRIDPTGTLITHEGHIVQTESNQPIRFEVTDDLHSLRISQDGTLLVTGMEGERQVDKLLLTTFEDAQKELKKTTASYFMANDHAKPITVEDVGSQLLNRTLEGANISPVQQMVDMIQSLRQFETAHKMLKSTIEMTTQQRASFGL